MSASADELRIDRQARVERHELAPNSWVEVASGFVREADRMTVEIVHQGEVVRELVRNRRQRAGPVLVVWDGRDESGTVVPEGAYRPRVRLLEQRRTITLPNRYVTGRQRSISGTSPVGS